MVSNHPAITLFQELLACPAPSGCEELIAKKILSILQNWGYKPETDSSGNVLVRIEGQTRAPLCIMAAHMDEIGMTVTKIENDGSLRVIRSGGLFPWKLGERPITILGDHKNIDGLVSFGAGHGFSANQAITWEQVRILTGLTPQELKEAGIRPGSSAVPIREGCGPYFLGNGEDPLVIAWTFDNRMGVVALLRMLQAIKDQEIRPLRPFLIAFTTQEETNGLGAKALAQREKPDVFIAVDGCPIAPSGPLVCDGRPGIRSKDALGHYDQALLRFFLSAAQRAGTELQPVAEEISATDASMVYSIGATHRSAALGIVRENSHGYEAARLSIFDNLYITLVEFFRSWNGE